MQAKKIFSQICPDEEFLPRPPNPEDIIYCDDESKKQSEGETFTSPGDEQQGQGQTDSEAQHTDSEAQHTDSEADYTLNTESGADMTRNTENESSESKHGEEGVISNTDSQVDIELVNTEP